MKRILAFLVLVSHINFSMFIPQGDEVDNYDRLGWQMDDINSLYEYIDQVALGNTDTIPEDGDKDTARYFHAAKVDTYCYNQQAMEVEKNYVPAFTVLVFI